jgi:hypothetical protein
MMAIRKQLYTWELWGDGTDGTTGTYYPPAGIEHSIFYGDYGNVQAGKQTGLVKEDTFIVIDKISCTPGISPQGLVLEDRGGIVNLVKWPPNMFVNVVIDTTNYYQDPQNLWATGVSGTASPYPITTAIEPYYELWPPIYVLPHQTVDIRYSVYNDITLSAAEGEWEVIPLDTLMMAVYCEYTLYDGTDGVLAQKLMKMGIPITVGSVENYRRLLLEHKGLETDTFQHYLTAMQHEKEREQRERKNQGLARNIHYGED